MGKRPVVLGCDLGDRNSAFGIIGEDEILHSSLLRRGPRTTWEQFCVQFHDEIARLVQTYAVDMIAAEDFKWYSTYAKVESPIRELIGITRLFSRSVPVQVIAARAWSEAITGMKPAKGNGFDRTRLWKSTVRAALTRRCALMGIDLDAVVGDDHGNHKVDSLGLALHAQDCAYVHAHARR
jgi:hypothetical protein